jgi:outer membrane receptor protein involved in Fe transport
MLAVAPLLVIAPSAANAQEPAAPAEIVVTGRGLDLPPAAAAYDTVELPRAALQQTGSGRIEDALKAVAGFQQFRRSDSRSANPSAQGVTLRALGGNATSRTLVLLDGVPQADPFFGYVPLSAIDPGSLAAARVTRGGGAGAFGSGAVAGTIELVSAGPHELRTISGQALVDDRGDTDMSARLAPRLGGGFAVLSGQWNRGDGFWTTPVSQRVPASVRAAYRSWSLGARAVAPLAPDVELQARVGAFHDARTLRFAGADTTSSGQDASLRLVGRGSWGFEALTYVQARDFSNVVISSSAPYAPTLDQTATPSTGIGGKLELRPPVGKAHVLRLGADWRRAEGTGKETRLVPSVQVRRTSGLNENFGAYLEDDWTIGAVILTGGARLDRWSIRNGAYRATTATGAVVSNLPFPHRAGWAGSFRGGALVHAAKSLDLRASAYSNIRQPTLNELYRSFVVGGITTARNEALGNERLVGIEGGMDWRPLPGLTMSVTLFDNEVRHAIANVTIDSTTRKRQNVGAVRARGIEATGGLQSGKFSLAASLSYTDAKVVAPGANFDGLRPAQTPKFAASATLGWHPRPALDLGLTLRHVGAQFEDDLQTDVLPAATTLDAFAAIPLRKGLALILRAENLTDVTVLTRNQSGSLDLGTPRTLWAGLRIGR